MAHNPYAPPQSDVGSLAVSNPAGGDRRRPALVWVIFVIYCLGLVSALITVPFIALGRFPAGNEVQQRYFASLSWFDHALSLAIAVIAWWAALEMFRLRKLALKWFIAALGLSVATLTYQGLLNPYWLDLMKPLGWIGVLASWIVKLLILAYVWRLTKRGVLV